MYGVYDEEVLKVLQIPYEPFGFTNDIKLGILNIEEFSLLKSFLYSLDDRRTIIANSAIQGFKTLISMYWINMSHITAVVDDQARGTNICRDIVSSESALAAQEDLESLSESFNEYLQSDGISLRRMSGLSATPPEEQVTTEVELAEETGVEPTEEPFIPGGVTAELEDMSETIREFAGLPTAVRDIDVLAASRISEEALQNTEITFDIPHDPKPPLEAQPIDTDESTEEAPVEKEEPEVGRIEDAIKHLVKNAWYAVKTKNDQYLVTDCNLETTEELVGIIKISQVTEKIVVVSRSVLQLEKFCTDYDISADEILYIRIFNSSSNVHGRWRTKIINAGYCWGIYFDKAHSLVNDMVNHIHTLLKDRIKGTNSSDKIKNIIKGMDTSIYSIADEFFIDYSTNVMAAIRRDNVVDILVKDTTVDHNILNYSVCINRILSRIYNKMSLDEMIAEDNKLFDDKMISNQNDFVEITKLSNEYQIKEMREEHENLRNKYDALIKKAMVLGNEAGRKLHMISAFDSNANLERDIKNAKESYNNTLEIEGVKSIYVKDKSIHVHTDNLYCQDDRDGVWHDIGVFHIVIGMYDTNYSEANTVRVYNTKHLIDGFEHGMPAPHVYRDGHICHGTLGVGMANAYARSDMFQLVLQLVLFLGQANTADVAGKYISSWPVVSEEVAKSGGYYDTASRREAYDNELSKYI